MRRAVAAIAILLGCAQQPCNAQITFVYNYDFDTNDFFADPDRREALEAAGTAISSRLNDPLAAITPGGSNTWTAFFFDPATGDLTSSTDLSIAEDTILVFAGGRTLGGGTLGEGGPGGFSASGSGSFLTSVATRGQPGAAFPEQSDVAPWGGSVAFDDSVNWHFDLLTDPASNQFDFFSVALHEIGHLLGLGIAIPGSDDTSWENHIIGNDFVGPTTGTRALFTPGLDHWAQGTMSVLPLGGDQEAAMDPDIAMGERKFFTVLDFAALDDIGWDVTPVPEPSAYALAGSGLCMLVLFGRRKARSSNA